MNKIKTITMKYLIILMLIASCNQSSPSPISDCSQVRWNFKKQLCKLFQDSSLYYMDKAIVCLTKRQYDSAGYYNEIGSRYNRIADIVLKFNEK